MTREAFRPLLLAAAACLLAQAPAMAQYYYNGYGGGYHASTAGESYARGMADAVRSQGMKNLADSRAAINVEQARSANIDNQLKATEAYWERKKIYDKNMAEKRYADAKVRAEHRERNMLSDLSPDDLDPTTGAVAWPALCKQDRYDKYRTTLDALFAKQGADGALSSDDYLTAKQTIKDFRAAITADRGEFPDNIISPSLRFLLKLDRELDANL